MKVLPARRAQDATPPVAPLAVLDELPLPGGCRVLVVRDAAGVLYTVPVTGPGTDRAGPGDGVAAALVGLLGPGPARVRSFELVRRYAAPATGEQAVTADQTNESVVVGGAAVVKWTVRPTTDPHPAPHRLAQLTRPGSPGCRGCGACCCGTTRAGPAPSRSCSRRSATTCPAPPTAGSGPSTTCARSPRVTCGRRTTPRRPRPLGRLTAELHLGLAGAGTRPATTCRGRRLARPGAGRPRPGRRRW